MVTESHPFGGTDSRVGLRTGCLPVTPHPTLYDNSVRLPTTGTYGTDLITQCLLLWVRGQYPFIRPESLRGYPRCLLWFRLLPFLLTVVLFFGVSWF